MSDTQLRDSEPKRAVSLTKAKLKEIKERLDKTDSLTERARLLAELDAMVQEAESLATAST